MSIQHPIPARVALHATWPGFAVVALHALFGEFFGHEPVVDPIFHFMGGFAVGHFVAALEDFQEAIFGRLSWLGVTLLVLGIAALTALAWELGELASDLVLGTTIQISARNTLRDLTLGVGGALLVCVLYRTVRRSRFIS